MATDSKTKYQKANELARARGYASEYAERKAKAIERGFSSPRTQRKASEQARGKQRDYYKERQRARALAREQGFRTVADRRRFQKLTGDDKTKSLAYFGISEYRFNQMRKENRLWYKENAMLSYTEINNYKADVDAATKDWSLQRVGYIVYFNKAIVNKNTNWESAAEEYTKENGKPGWKMNLKTKAQREAQFFYLVYYANIMSVSDFEARYGSIPI